FVGALGDAGEHDVHDDDAADHHENGHDPDGAAEELAGEVLPHAHDGLGGVDAEIVCLLIGKMVAGPHHGPGFVLQLHHLRPAPSLDHDVHSGTCHEESGEGGQGHLHEIVLALAQGLANTLGHADDAKWLATDINHLVDGVDGGEELIRDVLADEA